MLVAKDLVAKTPTVMPSTTEPSVPVLQISWEILIPDVILNVLVTVTAPATRHVSSSNAATLATSPTLMFAARVPPARPPTTRPSVLVPRAILVTHL